MLGYVEYREPGVSAPPVRAIGGVRFRTACVARGEGPFAHVSAGRAARALRRAGVRTAVFPADYAHRDVFAAQGVSAPPVAGLYRATAAAVARRYLAQRGGTLRFADVALAAAYPSAELRRLAEELSREARRLTLLLPRGGEELARQLFFARGVAARAAAPGEKVRADLTLCLEPCAAAPADALPLYDAALGVVYGSPLPNELLAALWSAGALDAQALNVRAVTLPGGPAAARTP